MYRRICIDVKTTVQSNGVGYAYVHMYIDTHMLYVSPEIERGVTKMAPIAALSLEIHIHTHTPFIFYSL